VTVLICDNGPGVPVHLRERIFDSFVTTKSNGTGLGLSLCKRFVESHGGRLELQTAGDGPGACFQIQLPVVEAASAAPNGSLVRP
jgi:two-component system CheB/CheR fusion protein